MPNTSWHFLLRRNFPVAWHRAICRIHMKTSGNHQLIYECVWVLLGLMSYQKLPQKYRQNAWTFNSWWLHAKLLHSKWAYNDFLAKSLKCQHLTVKWGFFFFDPDKKICCSRPTDLTLYLPIQAASFCSNLYRNMWILCWDFCSFATNGPEM